MSGDWSRQIGCNETKGSDFFQKNKFATSRLYFSFNSRHLSLGVLEAVRDEVDGLVFGDGVGLACGDWRVERPVLGLVAQAVLQLPEGGQEASTVSLQLSALTANAKLHREPVALRKGNIKTIFSQK